MGSSSPPDLPPASSPSLVLTQPTLAECRETWALTHPKWGPALSLDEYLSREEYLTTVPPGLTNWILTTADGGAEGAARPVLSSCETMRKRAVACAAGGGEVCEGVAHGIASVFTDPAKRGQGYARRMMSELGPRLAGWQVSAAETRDGDDSATGPDRALFSVLYSDIGKAFYAKVGWPPFESTHLTFPVPAAAPPAALDPPPAAADGPEPGVSPITTADLPALCAADEARVRARVRDRARSTGKTCAALLPDAAALGWHLLREDFMTRRLFGRTPAVRGAVYGGAPGRRVWAVWARAYYGGAGTSEGNTLHILRFVLEDEEACGAEEGYVAAAFRGVVGAAMAEARAWCAADVQVWNPGPVLRRAAEASGLGFGVVQREMESIASLMWYGEGDVSDVEWVANEKFGWC